MENLETLGIKVDQEDINNMGKFAIMPWKYQGT